MSTPPIPTTRESRDAMTYCARTSATLFKNEYPVFRMVDVMLTCLGSPVGFSEVVGLARCSARFKDFPHELDKHKDYWWDHYLAEKLIEEKTDIAYARMMTIIVGKEFNPTLRSRVAFNALDLELKRKQMIQLAGALLAYTSDRMHGKGSEFKYYANKMVDIVRKFDSNYARLIPIITGKAYDPNLRFWVAHYAGSPVYRPYFRAKYFPKGMFPTARLIGALLAFAGDRSVPLHYRKRIYKSILTPLLKQVLYSRPRYSKFVQLSSLGRKMNRTYKKLAHLQ